MLHISFGSDTNYAMQCGVAITSLCENNKELKLYIHILALCEENQLYVFDSLLNIINKYNQQGEIIQVEQNHFNGMPEGCYISKAAYLRLLLPKILNDDITQVLYLDSDTVVLGSLSYFIDFPLDAQEAAAAAIDLDGNSIIHHNRIDIPPFVPYFNSGVLFMNLDYWRKNDVTSIALANIRKYQYSFQDQDAINVILYDKIRILPFKFNIQVGFLQRKQEEYGLGKEYYEEIDSAQKDPIIFHYASYRKPWQHDCPYQDKWLKYRELTQWNNVPLETRQLSWDSLNDLIKKANKEAGVWLANTTDYYNFLLSLSSIRGGKYIIFFMSLQFRFFKGFSELIKRLIRRLRKLTTN